MNRDPRRLNTRKVAVRLATLAGLAVGLVAGILKAEILPLNVKVGDKGPDFALLSADGKKVRLSDFAGHNVLIDFYRAHW